MYSPEYSPEDSPEYSPEYALYYITIMCLYVIRAYIYMLHYCLKKYYICIYLSQNNGA